MEKDLSLAIKLLQEKKATCVWVKDEQSYIRFEKGIAPTLLLVDEGIDLNGFSVCDAVVGKAAAMLFSFVGVKSVHAVLISEPAIEFLKSRNIEFTYENKCKNIINRTKTDICPLEKATLEINDERIAVKTIRQTLENLRKNASK